MPHFTEFNSAPLFPEDVQIAKLDRISLVRLRSGRKEEAEALLEACKKDGFFLLELCGDETGDKILDEAGQLFEVGKRLFNLPYDMKMEHVMGGARSVFGYKGVGLSKVDAQGTPDRCEFYGISKDDLLGLSSQLSSPTIISSSRSLFKSFLTNNHAIELLILGCIENLLGLSPTSLTSLHPLNKLSGDQVRILKYDPQPHQDRRTSLVPHTDFGSVTSLFNIMGGLQVLPIGAENKEESWQYVKPQTGCAIINLGDSMVKWTNGLLKSAMHRVTYAPGPQAEVTRWSLAYFGHAHNGSLMKRMNGIGIPKLPEGVVEEDITAEDWLYVRSTSYKQKDMKDFERVVANDDPAPIVE